nr:unnamed protein product [uncultured bacterium]
MSRRLIAFLPFFCLLFSFLFSFDTYAADLGADIFNPSQLGSSGLYNSIHGSVHFLAKDLNNDCQSYDYTFNFGVYHNDFNKFLADSFSLTGTCAIDVVYNNYLGSIDSYTGDKNFDLTPIANESYHGLVAQTYYDVATNLSDVYSATAVYHLSYKLYSNSPTSGTFVVVPFDGTGWDFAIDSNDIQIDNDTRYFNGAIYQRSNWTRYSGNLYYNNVDLTDFTTVSPLNMPRARVLIFYVPDKDLVSNPLEGDWGTVQSTDWCEISPDDPYCQNKFHTDPNISNKDTDKFNISLDGGLLSGFMNLFINGSEVECVAIPKLAEWIHSSNSSYCGWWPISVIKTLTAIFIGLSSMLVFSFIIRLLKGSSDIVVYGRTAESWSSQGSVRNESRSKFNIVREHIRKSGEVNPSKIRKF